jgi:hypothetical protein
MTQRPEKRPVAVASACMAADGVPNFALTEVEVTPEEYENGAHYGLVEQRLFAAGHEEPFVHFDEAEAPAFLLPAVRRQVGAAGGVWDTPPQPEGGVTCPASSR